LYTRSFLIIIFHVYTKVLFVPTRNRDNDTVGALLINERANCVYRIILS